MKPRGHYPYIRLIHGRGMKGSLSTHPCRISSPLSTFMDEEMMRWETKTLARGSEGNMKL